MCIIIYITYILHPPLFLIPPLFRPFPSSLNPPPPEDIDQLIKLTQKKCRIKLPKMKSANALLCFVSGGWCGYRCRWAVEKGKGGGSGDECARDVCFPLRAERSGAGPLFYGGAGGRELGIISFKLQGLIRTDPAFREFVFIAYPLPRSSPLHTTDPRSRNRGRKEERAL